MLAACGFTERQARRLFDKLIRGGFATTELAAPARAGRVLHLQSKPWYRLLGEPDHRHKNPMGVGHAVERGGAPTTESVAGYSRLEVGASVLAALISIPEAGRCQEISLWPASAREGQ
jgi:hypothetical protein